MNRQEELAVGRRLLGHIDGRTTDLADALFRNRVDAYSCPKRAAAEREALFRSQPIFMGLSSRLAKPGDYLTEDVAGMPVLMTRAADGQVMAFANICRHRGAPVAQGCGNARAFTCPYHGWTYDTAGKLLGTTDKVGFAGLDLATHGLARLPAAEKHGMLFARAKPVQAGESADIDVDAGLGPIAADLAALRLETYPMFSADRVKPALDALRRSVAVKLDLIDKNTLGFAFVVDFPMFEWDEDSERWSAKHHLFTSCMEEDLGIHGLRCIGVDGLRSVTKHAQFHAATRSTVR